MDCVNYDDFQNICRTCLLMCEQKFLQNVVISKMYYMLMGIGFETNEQLPQQICLKCYQKMVEIDAFESQCKQAHCSLMTSLENYKNQIKIEEHKIEFVDVKDAIIDELQIKLENTEETSADETINAVQDNKNKLKMSFKRCFVRSCQNSTSNSNKIFISVPNDNRRKLWFNAINEKNSGVKVYCCEDHFNLPEDVDNWIYFTTIGQRIRMKKHVIPHLKLFSPKTIHSQSQMTSSLRKRKEMNVSKFNANKPSCSKQ